MIIEIAGGKRLCHLCYGTIDKNEVHLTAYTGYPFAGRINIHLHHIRVETIEPDLQKSLLEMQGKVRTETIEV